MRSLPGLFGSLFLNGLHLPGLGRDPLRLRNAELEQLAEDGRETADKALDRRRRETDTRGLSWIDLLLEEKLLAVRVCLCVLFEALILDEDVVGARAEATGY